MLRAAALHSLFVLPSLAIALLPAGCSSPAGTAAVVTGGAGLATYFGTTAATSSTLTVDVDVFAESATAAVDAFRLDGPAVMCRAMRNLNDPTVHPTPENITLTHAELIPAMRHVTNASDHLKLSAERLRNLIGSEKNEDTKRAMTSVASDFDVLSRADIRDAWREFDETFRKAKERNALPESLAILRQQLLALRAHLANAANYRVSREFVDYLKSRLSAGTLEMVVQAFPKDTRRRTALVKQLSTGLHAVRDDPLASSEARIALHLNTIRKVLQALPEEKVAERDSLLERILQAYGLDITPLELRRFRCIQETDLAVRLGFAPAQMVLACDQAYELTFSAITSSSNFGPIRDEIMQTLLTGPAIDIITDADYKWNWRRFNYAEVVTGVGDHDAVIYLENMATPIVKSSTFDPTKFIAASGQLYRTAFKAAADAFGVPGGTVGTRDMANVNLFSIRALRIQTEEATAKVNKAILAALKSVLEAQEKIKDATPAGLQGTLKGTADALDAAAAIQ